MNFEPQHKRPEKMEIWTFEHKLSAEEDHVVWLKAPKQLLNGQWGKTVSSTNKLLSGTENKHSKSSGSYWQTCWNEPGNCFRNKWFSKGLYEFTVDVPALPFL